MVVENMKREFFDKPPNLSGDEEIIAHAGEGEDQWANAQSAGGLFSAMNDRYDEDGKLTPKYKKLMEMLHMVDIPLHKPLTDEQKAESQRQLEEINRKWRELQDEKTRIKQEAREKIEEAWRTRK